MIYAIFNTETGVWQSSIIQGIDFDNIGDKKWKDITQSRKFHFRNSSDWIEISEEDYTKYLLGTKGGDNNTGYIRDMQTGECMSAPPSPFEVQIEIAQTKYNNQLQKITADYQNDIANAQLVDGDTAYVLESYQEKMNQLIANSNAELISIIEAAN